ncbi:MAG TPA: hypothetical protein DIW20_03610 [Rhodospirillaceae bacterium]|nr:hypothetical protein [Rhodospirillaceae bacterium]
MKRENGNSHPAVNPVNAERKIPFLLRLSPVQLGFAVVVLVSIFWPADENSLSADIATILWGAGWGIIFGGAWAHLHKSAEDGYWSQVFYLHGLDRALRSSTQSEKDWHLRVRPPRNEHERDALLRWIDKQRVTLGVTVKIEFIDPAPKEK